MLAVDVKVTDTDVDVVPVNVVVKEDDVVVGVDD